MLVGDKTSETQPRARLYYFLSYFRLCHSLQRNS